ncbi:hypothetical protein [Caballeronia fortuita]|uniref:hypothetical protein n=1 Tax=Caballeronia fortuita TaxID=1777138 RepID=UPI0012FE0659|nr:hypothetical protein [Caballeronia fortuita]
MDVTLTPGCRKLNCDSSVAQFPRSMSEVSPPSNAALRACRSLRIRSEERSRMETSTGYLTVLSAGSIADVSSGVIETGSSMLPMPVLVLVQSPQHAVLPCYSW